MTTLTFYRDERQDEDGDWFDPQVYVEFDVTDKGAPPIIDHINGGDPGRGAEYEIVSITDETGAPVTLTDVEDKRLAKRILDAIEDSDL